MNRLNQIEADAHGCFNATVPSKSSKNDLLPASRGFKRDLADDRLTKFMEEVKVLPLPEGWRINDYRYSERPFTTEYVQRWFVWLELSIPTEKAVDNFFDILKKHKIGVREQKSYPSVPREEDRSGLKVYKTNDIRFSLDTESLLGRRWPLENESSSAAVAPVNAQGSPSAAAGTAQAKSKPKSKVKAKPKAKKSLFG